MWVILKEQNPTYSKPFTSIQAIKTQRQCSRELIISSVPYNPKIGKGNSIPTEKGHESHSTPMKEKTTKQLSTGEVIELASSLREQ
jgi:hypothetical protein